MKTGTKSLMNRLAWGFLITALACLPMCGGQTEETPKPAAEEAMGEELSNDETKAVSKEFALQAEETINEENLEAEVKKIEQEIAADK